MTATRGLHDMHGVCQKNKAFGITRIIGKVLYMDIWLVVNAMYAAPAIAPQLEARLRA